MLFFPRSNRLFQWIAPIKSLYRYTLTLFTYVSLFGMWWFCIYTPLGVIGLSYTQENKIMHQQCNHDMQECHLLSSLEDKVKELHSTLDVYNVQVSSDPKEVHIHDLMNTISASGLTLSAYNVEREIDKKLYTKSIMRLSLVGGYQQLLNFFEQMHTQKMLISCKNISLHASEPEKYTITCELASFSWAK